MWFFALQLSDCGYVPIHAFCLWSFALQFPDCGDMHFGCASFILQFCDCGYISVYMHFGCGPLLYCACVCFALLYSGCGYFAVVWLCFVCYTCSLIVVALLYTVFVVALL